MTSLYKIIAKVLSNRIREVVYEAFDGNQFAFIKERNILDSFMIANECVEEYRRKKKRGCVLKLDLEKAFDRTCWDFLDFIMAKEGFGSRRRKWIEGCLSSFRFSIMIKETPQGFFPASRGLRQGDPIPFSVYSDSKLFQSVTFKRTERKFICSFQDWFGKHSCLASSVRRRYINLFGR